MKKIFYMPTIKPRKSSGIATIWDPSFESDVDVLELDKFKTEAMAARSNENVMELKELVNKVCVEGNRLLGVDDQSTGYIHSDISNKETPEPYYTHEIFDPIEDPGGWDDLYNGVNKNTEEVNRSIEFKQEKPKEDKSGWDAYNAISIDTAKDNIPYFKIGEPKETKPRKFGILNDVQRQERPVTNINQLDGDQRESHSDLEDFSIRFFRTWANVENIKHIVIFSLICLILKGLEVYGLSIWNEVKTFFSDNGNMFLAFWGVVVVLVQSIIRAPKTNHTGFK